MLGSRLISLALVAALAGCGASTVAPFDTSTAGDDTGSTDTGEEPEGFASSFESGKYEFTSLAIAPVDAGIDITGDDVAENNLPNALNLINFAISELDLSVDNLNGLIDSAILSRDLIYLLNALHTEGEMISDWLPGQIDSVTGNAEPTSAAYDSSGYPKSRMRGVFIDETNFEAGPGVFEMYLVFPSPYPTFAIPMEMAFVEAEVTALGASGTIGGAIPVDQLIDDVIEPLIPEEGVDTNGDGTINLTKQQLMNTVNALGENENVADIELSDGRRGISTALTFTASATEW